MIADRTEGRHERAAALIVAMSLGGMAYGLATTMILTAVPVLQDALDASTTGISWVVSAQLIAAAVATGIVGRLGDIFGRRRTLILSLVVFAAGSIVCAASAELGLVIAGRVVQGLGGGGVYPLAYAILREQLPAARRGRAIGMMAATLGIGGGIGPLLGGLVVDHASYRWIFILVGLLSLVSAAATAVVVRRPPARPAGRLVVDVRGACLLSATVMPPLVAISQANRWGWSSPLTLGLVAAGLVLLPVFVRFELGVENPLVNMRTLAHPVVLWTNLVGVGYSISAFGSLIATTLLAQQHEGSGYALGATAAGLILLPHGLCTLLGGRIAGHDDFRRSLVAGQAVILAALALFTWLFAERPVAYVVSAVVGVGLGLSLAATTNLVVRSVPESETAAATGITTVIRNIGGAFGVQVTIALFASSVVPGTRAFSDAGFTRGFGFLTAVAAVSIAVALAVPRGSR